MANPINSIEAAKIEAAGQGTFEVKGRTLVLRRINGIVHEWHCRTEKAAKDTLRLFRASLKYAA